MDNIYSKENQEKLKENLHPVFQECFKALEASGIQVRGYYLPGNITELVIELSQNSSKFETFLTIRANAQTQAPTTWSITTKG